MARTITALPPELTELIFKAGNRKVVIVEGSDDQYVLETWYRQNASDVLFYSGGGTAHVEGLVNLALAHSTKGAIYGIVDRDHKSDEEARLWRTESTAHIFVLWRYELEN